MTDPPAYTTMELQIVAIARTLRDGELGFVGVGTAGRAFALAVGIPLLAARLAQLTHAPDFTIYWGNLLSPRLDRFPTSHRQDVLTRWPASAALPDVSDKVDMLSREAFDVSFEAAAQIDRYGNLNITAIGDPARPRTRLVGSLAQPEHMAFVRRPVIVADLSPRTFVERVDYITSVGFYQGGRSRQALGLPGPGPALVVSDKALFDFQPESGEMRLASLYPGVAEEQVLERMGFRPQRAGPLTEVDAPTAEELRLLRAVVDPDRVILGMEDDS